LKPVRGDKLVEVDPARWRMLVASQRLRESRRSVAEVSLDIGCESEIAFCPRVQTGVLGFASSVAEGKVGQLVPPAAALSWQFSRNSKTNIMDTR
jgi:hypothetical protein